MNYFPIIHQDFNMLSSLDAVHVSAVLEDCVDQLAILGHIMPPSLEGRSDAAQIVDDELGQILQDQRFLESRYEAVRMKVNGAVNCILRNSSFGIQYSPKITHAQEVAQEVLAPQEHASRRKK